MGTLKDIYLKYWNIYLQNIRKNPNIEPANPFLLVEPKDYRSKAKRVMICGQETQGWGNEYDRDPDSATIEALLRIYAGFVNNGGYNSPYWQFINSLKNSCPNVGFICNNIVKIGRKYGPGCDDTINELTLRYFPVIPEEVSILNPDVILFLTGPRYDWRIKQVFGDFKMYPVNGLKNMIKISFFNTELPVAYRCYHPRYLRQCGQEKAVRNFLIEFLNQM